MSKSLSIVLFCTAITSVACSSTPTAQSPTSPLAMTPPPTTQLREEVTPTTEPTQFVSPLPSPTSRPPTASAPEQSIEPLDRTSPESIVKWVRYALEKENLSILDHLAYDTLQYGPCESEWIGTFTKKQFLDEVGLRLANHPKCSAYSYSSGAVTTLWVLTTDWNPVWDFGDVPSSEHFVFVFSDQWAMDEGLYLYGVCVTASPPPFENPIPCP